MFLYFVISPSGIPIFQYPRDKQIVGNVKINDVLFSGLITAINSFSFEATGQSIENISFRSITASFSKDKTDTLHVLIAEQYISEEIIKQIHLEIVNLYQRALTQSNPSFTKREEWNLPQEQTESIFRPFYQLWTKRIQTTSR